MSVYLGKDKVGIAYMEENENTLSPEKLNALNNAVGYITGDYTERNVDKMIADLKKERWINRQDTVELALPIEEEPWIRPTGWPDLDSLNLVMSGNDFIYMTYDMSKKAAAVALHIETTDRLPATIDFGHINNGTYIVDETFSADHNTNFLQQTDDYSGYIVVRVTGQIARCSINSMTRDGQTTVAKQQPMVERIAWVPHLTGFCGSGQSWGTYILERDTVANGDGIALTTMYCSWQSCYNLRKLEISGLRTPNITNMESAFSGFRHIAELDLRHLFVGKVTTFNNIFNDSQSLQKIDLTGWDTGNATNFNGTFYYCRALSDLKGAWNFDTQKATTMSGMFSNCYNLPELNVENYIMDNVTNFSSMFTECHRVRHLDLSNWKPKKVTNLSTMFSGCWNLEMINFDGWETGIITNASGLFTNCRSLKAVDISWLHITSACTSIGNMFYYCHAIEEINIPNDWDVSGLSSSNYTAYNFFGYCYNVKKITGIANWNFQLTNSISGMFMNCWSLEELDVSGWNVSTVTNISSMFANCWSLKELDISSWHAGNATAVNNMFDYCYSLEEVDITNLKPGAITTMAAMFRSCVSLKSFGNIDDWDLSACTRLESLFQDCFSLKSIPDITQWDLQKAENMSSMFSGCKSIKEIQFDNITLPNCTTVSGMFGYCENLKKVHLTGWSLPKVTSTSAGTFLAYCNALQDVTIDIPFIVNHSFYSCWSLSHESLLNILNNLPTVTTRKSLALTNQNINRLTAEEKQIATNKNWTLTNS